ncbi:hypothetical protein FRX31_031367, partial [Thalictrum thalictroides]
LACHSSPFSPTSDIDYSDTYYCNQVFIFQQYKYGVASLCYNLTNFVNLL